jgi:hypothetical protein
MHADCSELINGLRQPLRELRSGTADVMKAFSAIAQAASKANALDTKTKDLSSRPLSWRSTWEQACGDVCWSPVTTIFQSHVAKQLRHAPLLPVTPIGYSLAEQSLS